MNNTIWINVEDELPPYYGSYECTNDPDSIYCEAILTYDGIGFIHLSHYVPAKFWRHPIPIMKKYGKVKNE